ncbi:MAG: hypothetical protein IBJ03_07345 [Gemmatimonadaceae bacterium]|nr:hypothetical protein [Gemmatimonadaceae bacterium]
MSDVPRQALERVLARASELQTQSSTEPGDAISESRLLEIAKEVGLDVQHVKQALAEERAQMPVYGESGDSASLAAYGPAVVSAQRTVRGTPAAVLQRLEQYLPRNESLTPVRRAGDRMVWEPRRDPMGNLLRSIGGGGKRFDLVRLDQLVITATAVDDERTVLRFDAVVAGARKSARMGGVATIVAMTFIALLGMLPVFLISTIIPAVGMGLIAFLVATAGAVSWFSWRGLRQQFRTMVGRAQTRLELLLDDEEQGRLQASPTLLEKMLKGI